MSAEEGSTARQAAIGAFVLVGTGLALAAIVLFGNFHPFSHTIKAAIVFQDSISGLSIGAPVTFRGVHVGAVAAIAVQFDQETQTALIPVTVQLDPGGVVLTTQGSGMALDLPDLVTHGLRAELNTQSFVTGQSEIDLNFYPNEPAVLHPSLTTLPEIPTRQSTLQRVRDELSQLPLHELAENTLATLRSLRGLTEKLDQSLPPLIESLRTTSDRSAAALATASESVTRLQARADTTLGHLDKLIASGGQFLTVRGGELHTVLQSSNQAILQARDRLDDLKSLTSDRGADRANIDALLRDLATASGALRGLARDVERNPQLLLTGRRP